MKLLIVSDLRPFALAQSYVRAIKNQMPEIELITFDILARQKKYIRLGKFGEYFHRFVPVEAWTRKVNRELAVVIKETLPDVVLIFGNSPVMYGSYMFLKSYTQAKTVLYWPDTLINLEQHQINAAPFIDLLATYSKNTIKVFEQMGCKKSAWVPFAYDQYYLGDFNTPQHDDFTYDISFIGGWRPEREKVMATITEQFPDLKIAVRGPYWKRFTQHKKLKTLINNKPLFGKDFAQFFRKTRININIIDDTNYPAVNMRFFEIAGSGGLQVVSHSPEMENVYLHNEDVVYFTSPQDACLKINELINNVSLQKNIRNNCLQKTRNQHTYLSRTQSILNQIT